MSKNSKKRRDAKAKAAKRMHTTLEQILRLAKNPATEDLFMRINRELSCAA